MALTKIPGHLLDTTGHIDFADNEQLRLGNTQGLLIYHSGTHSHVRNTSGGNLYLQDDGYVEIGSPSGEVFIGAIKDGAVNLRYDNVTKIATTSGGVTVTGGMTADSLSVDSLSMNGTSIGSSGNMTLDVAGDIIFDAGGQNIYFDDDGTRFLSISQVSNDVYIGAEAQDKDIIFRGKDGSSTITALTLDMSDAGTATFNHDIFMVDDGKLRLGNSQDMILYHSSNANFLKIVTPDQDFSIHVNDGGSNVQALLFDASEAGAATFNNAVTVGGDLSVSGNLNITGDINSTSVTNLDVTDKTITVANNAGSSSAADGAGLIVDTGGTLPSLLWDHSNSAFQFSKALRVVNTVRIVGGDTSGSSYGLIVKNSSNANTLLVRNDGVVQIDTNYLYVNNNNGIYSNGAIKARGGIHNDQGDLTLNDTVQVAGPMVIQGSTSQERYLAFTLDGKSSAFSGSNNCFIFNGQGSSGDFLAGALYFQSRSATAGREIGFITGTTPAKRMVITSTGNVGIGDDSPSEKLEIGGTNGSIRLGGMRLSNAGAGRIGLNRNPADGSTPDASLRRFQINGPDASGGDYLDFQSYNSSGTFQGYFVLQDGKLGIGTNAPTHNLTVYSQGTSGSVFRRSTNAGQVMNFQFGGSAAGNITVQSGGLGFGGGATEDKLFIDTAGSVGFGTSSPQRPFDVRQSLSIFGTGGYTELMMRGRAGTAQNLGAFHWAIRGDVGGNNDDLMLLRFTGGNSPSYAGTSMHIRNDNGFIGIGTNTGQPSSPLHIKSDTEFQLKIEASASAGASQQLYTPGGYAYTVYQNGSATWRQGAYGGSNYILRNHGTSVDEFTLLPSGSLKLQTATQSETGIAQLELQNNVNANPSHVNIKFNTYAWLGMIQCEQRSSVQHGALNFWTANNGNPTQKMCLNNNGNLCLANSANQDGVNPKHRVIAVTGSTTVTATSWSVSPGSNGGYDVSNDDSSEFSYNGAYTGAGYYNRHIAKFCLVGNYTADTWYPIVASDQLFDWVSSGSPGANPWDGFSMYFRIYTYDISAGGSEYLSHRMTDRIWVNGYSCNSNQRHQIAIGAGWGHAPNGGQSNDHQDYGSNPYQMSVNHHYNNDSYYPAKQTVEFKFKTARTGLTEAHSAQSVYVYAYVG